MKSGLSRAFSLSKSRRSKDVSREGTSEGDLYISICSSSDSVTLPSDDASLMGTNPTSFIPLVNF